MPRAGAYQIVAQTDFSGGMYRAGDPELMPANSFFDGENTLLDRLGSPFARGGAAFADSEALDADGLTFVWDGYLGATPAHFTIVGSPNHFAKLIAGKYTTFGTGMSRPGRAAAFSGVLYLPGGATYDGTTLGTAANVQPFYTIAANRLIAAGGHRVAFSKVNTPGTFEASDYHEIPGGAEILGVEGSRESCVVFTTRGVWIISGLALNLTDAAGNVQHKLDHYSGDLLLWGDAGISAWEGSLVVPAMDAVWLIRRGVTSEQPQSFTRLSDPIVELYQSYTAAGYRPGQATVYRNHYFLPIFTSGRIVDVLVARLDLADRKGNVPWTHLAGVGAEVSALAVRNIAGAPPELLGAEYAPSRAAPTEWGKPEWGAFAWGSASGRTLALAYLEPSSSNAFDPGNVPVRWSLETRDIATAGLRPNVCAGARLRYTLAGPPSAAPERVHRFSLIAGPGSSEDPNRVLPQITAEFASDTRPRGGPTWGTQTWGAFAWALPETESYEPLGNAAPPSQDAAVAHRWRFARKRRFVRMRFTCSEPTSQLQLRSLELFVRQDARL